MSSESLLQSWRDTPTRHAIVDFVGAVTDERSENFLPAEARIAVFDNDDTLFDADLTFCELSGGRGRLLT